MQFYCTELKKRGSEGLVEGVFIPVFYQVVTNVYIMQHYIKNTYAFKCFSPATKRVLTGMLSRPSPDGMYHKCKWLLLILHLPLEESTLQSLLLFHSSSEEEVDEVPVKKGKNPPLPLACIASWFFSSPLKSEKSGAMTVTAAERNETFPGWWSWTRRARSLFESVSFLSYLCKNTI